MSLSEFYYFMGEIKNIRHDNYEDDSSEPRELFSCLWLAASRAELLWHHWVVDRANRKVTIMADAKLTTD